jgi:ATP-binding cassette subfamily B protein
MSPLRELLAPVRVPLTVSALLQAVAAAASIVPFICVVEIARRLLAPPADKDEIRALVAVAVAAFGLRLLAQGLSGQITHLADNTFQLAVRRRVAAQLGRLPLGWFGARHSGEVKRAVQDDVSAMHYMVAHSLPDLVAGVVAPTAALVYLVSIDWRLTRPSSSSCRGSRSSRRSAPPAGRTTATCARRRSSATSTRSGCARSRGARRWRSSPAHRR